MNSRSSFELNKPGALSTWFGSFTHILFPERCLFCRAVLSSSEGPPTCSSCGSSFAPAGYICPACERLLSGGQTCSCCLTFPCLQSLFALSFYEKQWRFLLHSLKYHKRRSLARPLGRWLGLEIAGSMICQPDLVVPVPLHCRREKERGYNQSSLIAHHTARVLGKKCLPLLKKNTDTISQATLSRRERFENIRGAFSCSETPLLGTTVLLIDDIYSTGSTLNEAAKALCRSGAEVHGAVIAYNPLIK